MPSDHVVGNDFGVSADIDGSLAIVGAPRTYPYGAAYVFYKSEANGWIQLSKIASPDILTQVNGFASAVGVSGLKLAVGDSGRIPKPAVLLYSWGFVGWVWTEELTAADPFWGSQLGWVLDLDGDRVITYDSGGWYNNVYVFQPELGFVP